MTTNDAAIEAALRGFGITRLLSYQVGPLVAAGELKLLLEKYEPPPLPIHIVHQEGRHASAKIRTFVDLMVQRLRKDLALVNKGRRDHIRRRTGVSEKRIAPVLVCMRRAGLTKARMSWKRMREPLRFLVLSRIAFLEHFAEHVPSDLVVCWTPINSGDVGHPTTDIAIGGCPIGPSDGAGLASGFTSMLANFDLEASWIAAVKLASGEP